MTEHEPEGRPDLCNFQGHDFVTGEGFAVCNQCALTVSAPHLLADSEHQRVPATSEDTADGERGF